MKRKEYTLVGSALVEKANQEPEEQKIDQLAPVLPVLADPEEELEIKEQGDGH